MTSRLRWLILVAALGWLARSAIAATAVAPAARPAAAFAAATADPVPACNISCTTTPSMSRLAAVMATGRFIAYEPTSLQVDGGHVNAADPASIRADLKVLRPRFDGLITYTAVHGAEAIPGIAAALGYRAVIIGIWDPFDETEISAALEAARHYPRLVVGVSLGNEVVFAKRHGFPELTAAAVLMHRRAPELPISSTEPFHLLYGKAAAPLLNQLDFLLVNVHPVFQPWFRGAPDANAAQFVVNVVSKLADEYCGPIIVKETGVPTAPAGSGFSEERQASFYFELQRVFPAARTRAFAYFAAFDAPWRAADVQPAPGDHPEEAHWGLYDGKRNPKPVTARIALLN